MQARSSRGRILVVAALAVVGLSACSSSSPKDAAAETRRDAPTDTRAAAPLGSIELPDLDFAAIDDKGTVAADITSEALFDLNSATLKPEVSQIVDQIANRLAATPSHVRVDGYTDGLGETAHNQQLSKERAEALAQRIRDLGTAASVLSCGRGEEGSDGSSAQPELRRVVVTISVDPLPEDCS